jgi:putative intracellular protease/amidase
MQIAFALYEGFTALDIVGPYQVLAEQPGHQPVWVAATPGPVMDHTGHLPITAEATFDEITAPDIVVVPGGVNVSRHLPDHPIVGWLQRVHPTTTWTTSVCTGSLLLAGAGLLAGVEASCHWASTELLNNLGATYVKDRVVHRGKIVTAAGVSSGIDMALTLTALMHGDFMAQAIQLAIEYDPQPPFDAGSPDKAPAEVVALVRSFQTMS